MTPLEAKEFRKALFKAGQQPSSWLSSAESLRDAAEIILQGEAKNALSYSQEVEKAKEELAADPTVDASAEIRCEPPNYLPGQLLYGYALENVLKGLIIANDPSVANETKLDDEIAKHELVDLAATAKFDCPQEVDILKALTQLSVWAGRYPVARKLKDHTTIAPLSDSHALLDYGAHHHIVRNVFDRALAELKSKVPASPRRFGLIVRVAPDDPPERVTASLRSSD